MAKREEAYEPVIVESLGDLRRFLKEIEDFPDDTKVEVSTEGNPTLLQLVINGGWPPNTNPSVWVHVEEVEEDEEGEV